MTKKNFFGGVFRNQEIMKRGEMQKNFFRFFNRLPYFSFYRTIVLNVKVKSNRIHQTEFIDRYFNMNAYMDNRPRSEEQKSP